MGRKKQEEKQEKAFGDECPILGSKRIGLWLLTPATGAVWGTSKAQSCLTAACLPWAAESGPQRTRLAELAGAEASSPRPYPLASWAVTQAELSVSTPLAPRERQDPEPQPQRLFVPPRRLHCSLWW